MTKRTKETLIDIAAYCKMAREGRATPEQMIDKILEVVKPFFSEEVRKTL